MGLFDTNPWTNPDTGLLGVSGDPATSRPQLPSPEQFAQDYRHHSLLSGFSKGLLPGIINAIAGPDPAAMAQAYNGLLTGAQGAETGRLNTAYYDNANGAAQGGADWTKTPTSVQVGPAAGDYPPSTAQTSAAPPGQGLLGGYVPPLPGPQRMIPAAYNGAPAQRPPPSLLSAPQPAQSTGAPLLGGTPGVTAPIGARGPVPVGGWSPSQALAGIARAATVPALGTSLPAYLSNLDTLLKTGMSVDANGNITNTPGALAATTLDALAKAHISPGNVDPMNPGSVTSAVAGQAGATKGAEANAQNASDLRFKPSIEAGVANAKLPAAMTEAGYKTYLDSLAKWVNPTETRPGNDVVQFSGTGAPRVSQFMPGSIGSTSGSIPVGGAASAPAAPAMLYSNNGETYKTGQTLADETANSRVAADGAYTQRALYQKMLDSLQGANLGALSADRTAFKNFVGTFVPGIDTSKSVTQDQVFDKLSTQVAGQATRQLDQTANAALETMRKAYPNRDMTPQALREMVGQLSGLQDYIIAKDQARQTYISARGSASGFTQGDWVKQNTPDKFIAGGILNTVPAPARAMLQQNPKLAGQFDAKYGPGMSNLVLGGQH